MKTKHIPALLSLALVAAMSISTPIRAAEITPAEARAIAKEAYIYGFPLVDNLRVQYSYFTDQQHPEYKAPYNTLLNIPRVFTPDDKAMQTPNSDTPYSWVGLDFRAEPIVVTVPAIEKSRYWSLQLIDLYTHNFDYLGTRTTGNEGGSFMLAGPRWQGETPKGITKVIRCETEIALGLIRTQLFNLADLDNVKKIQDQYSVKPLSAFLGQAATATTPVIAFPKPLTPDTQKTSLEFFQQLNFALQFCPTHSSEKELMARLAGLNVGAGLTFDPTKLSSEMKQSIEAGMADGWAEFAGAKKQVEEGKLASGDIFGTRDFLQNNYVHRMAAAVLGIYGNSKQEAMYPAYYVDDAKQPLNGANRYTLHFAEGKLPPVNAFWSLTMYEQPASLLAANPINRYLLNSTMLAQFKRDADGGLTLYVQHESPGTDHEANWLPAPAGPFSTIMRLYLPKEEALSGKWTPPPLKRVAQAQSAAPIKVTPATYIRAESDRSFFNLCKQAGGVNQLLKFRSPTPLDQQTVVRMNKDTLYTGIIVDTEGGATITIPEIPKGRFMSAQLVDNDHYGPDVFYTPGTHKLPSDTKYLFVNVRIQLFDPTDRAEIELVNKLQDQIVITAAKADPVPPLKWNMDSLKALTVQYEKESAQHGSYKGMMGPRGKVDEKTRHLAAAAAWGLNPEWDATYLNYSGEHDPKLGYKATYKVPENGAFWSITVYGSDGYMKSENNIVNSTNAKLNADGTFTVYYGSQELCGDVPNRLDVTDGWNFLMRIYRPGPSVLDGSYKVAKAEPMK